jgi:hypothetical protein
MQIDGSLLTSGIYFIRSTYSRNYISILPSDMAPIVLSTTAKTMATEEIDNFGLMVCAYCFTSSTTLLIDDSGSSRDTIMERTAFVTGKQIFMQRFQQYGLLWKGSKPTQWSLSLNGVLTRRAISVASGTYVLLEKGMPTCRLSRKLLRWLSCCFNHAIKTKRDDQPT